MKYELVVVTDGRPGMLDQTLAAFDARVRPRPARTVIYDDSGDPEYGRYLSALVADRATPNVRVVSSFARRGFCVTVARAWLSLAVAADDAPPWVYWLEDDFVHVRSVDLVELAGVLSAEPHVAQMALYRNPVSPEEIAAGGYIGLRPETYEPRGVGSPNAWLEHRNFWTTNPSLFRRSITRELTWPRDPRCEGLFAIELARARTGRGEKLSFGIWGTGTPWVEHIGVRSGEGY